MRTSGCGRQGHPEFRIVYDPAVVVVPGDVRWFRGWLEDSVAAGARYEPGQTCQVGWMAVEVQEHRSGDLTLWEPDLRTVPVRWTEGVSRTLAHLRLQKDVVESVLTAEDLSFSSWRQSAIVCTRLARGQGIVLERSEPDGANSGWFCGCQEEGHDHQSPSELRRVSLYEAAVRQAPQIIPYLALPAGVLVGVGTGAPLMFRDGETLEFRPGSYLALRYADG